MTHHIDIETIDLLSGSHLTRESGMCALEAVAYIAAEPHSDHPACASPVIAAFLRSWNDSLRSNSERNRLLRPLLYRVGGSRAAQSIEDRRAWMAIDWLIREYTPAWLELTNITADAAAFRDLPEIVSLDQITLANPLISSARQHADAARAAARDAARAAAWAAARAAAWDAAWDAARAAARDAARAAAWAAARDAAGAAARDAAGDAAGGAAWDAARAATWAAARDATWAAARATTWDAARDALAPTVEILQQSALALVGRMLDLSGAPS